MAVKRWIPLNQITGVGPGSTATINLPTGLRYHQLHFEYTTDTAGGPTEVNMETELTEWRLNIDGITQRRCSTAQLFDINRTKGKTPVVGATKGYAPFYFSEPQRETYVAREASAWGMKGVGTFQIEVDIANVATQTCTLKGRALVDDLQEAPAGIVKWKREIIQVSATGELTYKLDSGKGDSYQGLHFFEGTAGDIGNLRLLWDGVEIYNGDEHFYDSLLPASDYTAVAGLFHVPLDHGNPSDILPMVVNKNGTLMRVEEFLATLTMDQAANVTLIREVVGSPD